MAELNRRAEIFIKNLYEKPLPLVMGIINASPDSFYEPSRVQGSKGQVEQTAIAMEKAGVDIFDLGAESSRPGSTPISEQAEIDRLMPVLLSLRSSTNLPISIDTHRASVARLALENGADLVNDIYALNSDPALFDLLIEKRCPIILMHMQGDPATMQVAPHYQNVVSEVTGFLKSKAQHLVDAGFDQRYIILDPGLGFGKSYEHNLGLLRCLEDICALGYPILLGHSRKGFIGTILADSTGTLRDSSERLAGTLAVGLHAAAKGVRILRVHDVQACVDTLRVYAALKERAA